MVRADRTSLRRTLYNSQTLRENNLESCISHNLLGKIEIECDSLRSTYYNRIHSGSNEHLLVCAANLALHVGRSNVTTLSVCKLYTAKHNIICTSVISINIHFKSDDITFTCLNTLITKSEQSSSLLITLFLL